MVMSMDESATVNMIKCCQLGTQALVIRLCLFSTA